MRFQNEVVIITGATSKLGVEISIQFILEGASVVLVGKNEEKLDALKTICDAQKDISTKHAFVITADLTVDDEVRSVINQTIEKHGKINVLINNAEIDRKGEIFHGSILETYDDVMKINLRAVVAMTTFATPHLISSKGNIVNVSSVGAERILCTNRVSYFLSKAGLNHFTRACALELGRKGVRVNTVSVGAPKETIAYKRCLDANVDREEVAKLVLLAASKNAKGMTGSNLVTDCGNLVT